MLIVLSGLPATGKSVLAAGVAVDLGAFLLAVDPVDSAMLTAGVRQTEPHGIAAYAIVGAIAEANLDLGATVVVDAVNAVADAKGWWLDLARRRDVRLLAVETICSDPTLHRRRLEGRRRDLGIPEPTWDTVGLRRDEWAPWPFPPLVVDAVLPLEDNIARVVAAARAAGL